MNGISEIKRLAYRHALVNAYRHGGKASVEVVVGKVLAERCELRSSAKQVTLAVVEAVKEVNKLSHSEQKKLVEGEMPDLLAEKVKETEKVLPPLPNAEKYRTVVTRFSPNPDCVLHLGSVRAVVLSHDYARIYGGRFYLRFEDTDPRLKKSTLEYYDLIRQDIKWLDCDWDQEFIQSERLPIYYDHAPRLLKAGGAYVCTCERQSFSRKVSSRYACPCRDIPTAEQMSRWEKMLDGTYAEGQAIVRIKTDIDHPNPAVRDWPALRIIDTEKNPHPLVGDKYRVWPLYNYACGIDDHLMGITHIIRGKEHVTNTVRQKYMYDHLGWDYPETIHYGRLKVEDADLSKSKILRSILEGRVGGFDDPRLATLMALRRRGISPKALRKIAVDIGPKAVDITLSWENIYAANRKIVDRHANRYFFLKDPIELRVAEVPKTFVSRPLLHPDFPERGYRVFHLQPADGQLSLLVSRSDILHIRDEGVARLMELFNVKLSNSQRYEANYLSESLAEGREKGARLIHWLPQEGNVSVSVMMPSGAVIEGVGEPAIRSEKVDATVQLVRFGFARVDHFEDERVRLCFAHP